MSTTEIRHFHAFVGLGGGAKGFNKANPRVGNTVAKFRCIGGVDVDQAAIRDFQRLTGARGTVLDMFDRDQYRDFHGAEPPAGWSEATTADIHRAAGNERPHVVFLSAPCKGFSGLLSEGKSKTLKYLALNRLTLRGVWLMLEAWKHDPVEIYLFENVPRIATRGRHLLDQIADLFRAYGYAWAETTHDCGEIGNLAQSRKRFLGVARHTEKVPTFLYEPEKRPLRAVGDVLGRMVLPGDLRAGPMHRVPSLQWKTWVRLAFVEAGSDWRSLNKLTVENGHLRDYLIVPDYRRGYLGVNPWDASMGTVAGESLPSNGAFSIADPRFSQSAKWTDGQAYGVRRWSDTSGTIGGQQNPGQGAYAVADIRHAGPAKHSNEFKIVPWGGAANAVTSAHGSGQALADPRPGWDGRHGHLHVADWEHASRTVTAGGKGVQGGYLSVADPRSGMQRGKGDNYLTAGHYGVARWNEAAGAVSAAACHDNGRWSVADPRGGTPEGGECSGNVPATPAPADKLVCRIQALDGTWHRPFTTLELAALQSLIEPEEHLELDGLSDQAWRERIGNAVPSDAAEAIAGVIGTTLLLAWSGETFMLSSQPIWVRDVAVALTVRGAQ
ncbi:DNA cytosine methyltransferase [Variovorax paradoxus]|nr:DNA cytosine methyltransferase [Variovorax paradoxus]